jgi:hypothetical protein
MPNSMHPLATVLSMDSCHVLHYLVQWNKSSGCTCLVFVYSKEDEDVMDIQGRAVLVKLSMVGALY